MVTEDLPPTSTIPSWTFILEKVPRLWLLGKRKYLKEPRKDKRHKGYEVKAHAASEDHGANKVRHLDTFGIPVGSVFLGLSSCCGNAQCRTMPLCNLTSEKVFGPAST